MPQQINRKIYVFSGPTLKDCINKMPYDKNEITNEFYFHFVGAVELFSVMTGVKCTF